MLKRTLHLLKQNPALIILYIGVQLVTQLILLFFYPTKMSDFGITGATVDFHIYIIALSKLVFGIIIIYVIGLLFYSGYGNMLREAARQGKTAWNAFGNGIAAFFVRVLLGSLLLAAFAFAVSIVLSVVTIPIILLTVLNGNTASVTVASILMTIMIAFVIPFVLLWFPAIFVDDTGVIQGMKNGARAGVKNYWRLLLIVSVLTLPMIIVFAVNAPSTYVLAEANESILSPGYYAVAIVETIVGAVLIPYLFVLYHEYATGKLVNDPVI